MNRTLYRLALLLSLLLTLVSTVRGQGLSDPALQAAINAANAAQPSLGRPDRWEFEILLPTRDSALSCPLVPGVQLPDSARPFIVTLFYGETGYVVHVAEDGSRTQTCDPALAPTGMTGPAMNFTGETTADACTVTPSGPFANVRARPDTDAELLTTIEAPASFPALGRDPDFTWYLIREGWVAGTVVNATGNCLSNDLSIRDASIATGLISETLPTPVTNATPAPGATILPPAALTSMPSASDFVCPPDFEGYLPPRIRTGDVTAQVEQGGLPNSLRSLPSVNVGERTGQIQPGRRIDRVLNGPRCSDGYVWWQVNIDGVVGWTAESSAADNSYFLAPTAGNAVATPTPAITPTPAPPPTSTPTSGVNIPGAVDFAVGEQAVIVITDEAVLVLPNAAPAPIEIAFDLLQITETPTAIAITPDETRLFIGFEGGGVAALDLTSFDPISTPAALHEAPVNAITFTPDGTRFVTAAGDPDDDSGWSARLWDTAAFLSADDPQSANLRNIRFPYPMVGAAFSPDGGTLALVGETFTPQDAAGLWLYADGGLGANTATLGLGANGGQTFVVAGDGVFFTNGAGALLQVAADTGTQTTIYERGVVAAAVSGDDLWVLRDGIVERRPGGGEPVPVVSLALAELGISGEGEVIGLTLEGAFVRVTP